MKINNEVLYRFFAGSATPHETDLIEEWLNQNQSEHQKIFNQAYKMHVMGILSSPEIAHQATPTIKRRIMRPIYKYVVGIAAALAIGFGVNYAFFAYKTAQWSQQITSLEVPAGQHIRLTLSDGSVVNLNSGTTIEYPSIFIGRERNVKISGEAMFEVTHDAERPFTVETFACKIKVLGTKFNVIADQTEKYVATALLNGSVLVTNNSNDKEQIVMKPQSIVSWRNGHLSLSQIENHDEYLWPNGIINLSGIPFDQLMDRFEKYYNVHIDFKHVNLPEINYKRCKVRVSEGIEHALDILMLGSDFSYTFDKETNIITIQ